MVVESNGGTNKSNAVSKLNYPKGQKKKKSIPRFYGPQQKLKEIQGQERSMFCVWKTQTLCKGV